MSDIKSELRYLIEQETDETILKAIRAILEKTQLNPALKEELTRRALTAEEDIKRERVFTREQVVTQTNHLFNK